MDRALVQRTVGGASLLAGLLHGGLAPAHFDEWWGYGAFFLGVATLQTLFGLALMMDVFLRARDRRVAYVAGALMNLGLIALYAWSRVLGVPLLGPDAGVVEEVALVDLVTKSFEVVIVVGCLWLASGKLTPRPAEA